MEPETVRRIEDRPAEKLPSEGPGEFARARVTLTSFSLPISVRKMSCGFIVSCVRLFRALGT